LRRGGWGSEREGGGSAASASSGSSASSGPSSPSGPSRSSSISTTMAGSTSLSSSTTSIAAGASTGGELAAAPEPEASWPSISGSPPELRRRGGDGMRFFSSVMAGPRPGGPTLETAHAKRLTRMRGFDLDFRFSPDAPSTSNRILEALRPQEKTRRRGSASGAVWGRPNKRTPRDRGRGNHKGNRGNLRQKISDSRAWSVREVCLA
jgi:hypothetical protein